MELTFLIIGAIFGLSYAYMVFLKNTHRIIFLACAAIANNVAYCLLTKGYVFYWRTYWEWDDGGNIGRSIGEFIGSMIVVSAPLLIALIIHIIILLISVCKNLNPEDHVYKTITEEIEQNKLDDKIWAIAFCKASGDKEKAIKTYIKLRIKELNKNPPYR